MKEVITKKIKNIEEKLKYLKEEKIKSYYVSQSIILSLNKIEELLEQQLEFNKIYKELQNYNLKQSIYKKVSLDEAIKLLKNML